MTITIRETHCLVHINRAAVVLTVFPFAGARVENGREKQKKNGDGEI